MSPTTTAQNRMQAGDAYVIEPGRDAQVVGDEPFVGFELEPRAAEEFARG